MAKKGYGVLGGAICVVLFVAVIVVSSLEYVSVSQVFFLEDGLFLSLEKIIYFLLFSFILFYLKFFFIILFSYSN